MKKYAIGLILLSCLCLWSSPIWGSENQKGALTKILLTLSNNNGKSIQTEVTHLERLKVGDRVAVDGNRVGKNRNGDTLVKIELTITRSDRSSLSASVGETGRISVDDQILIKNNKAKRRGKGRGC